LFNSFREAIATHSGKRIGVGIAMVMIGSAAYLLTRSLKSAVPEDAYSTTYICTETQKPFRHRNQIGETQPVLSPHSGKNTGVTAESCFWTADGTAKNEPSWVLLEELVGRPGPTFCPECRRLVVPRNPRPAPGAKAPPTKAEYASLKASPERAFIPRDDRSSR
jgi:hypothetical protein